MIVISLHISNSKIYLYKRFYSPNESNTRNTIFEYSLEGDFLDSYGIFPTEPCVDNLPFSSGSINLKDSLLITAHGSDFFCNIYNIRNNNSPIKLNISQPSFYYKLKEFKGLTPAYRKEWYKTTELLYANILFDKSIILYYKQVDGSKRWLVIHTNDKNKEILIPKELNFLGSTNDKRIYFIKLTKTKGQFELMEYEIKE